MAIKKRFLPSSDIGIIRVLNETPAEKAEKSYFETYSQSGAKTAASVVELLIKKSYADGYKAAEPVWYSTKYCMPEDGQLCIWVKSEWLHSVDKNVPWSPINAVNRVVKFDWFYYDWFAAFDYWMPLTKLPKANKK